ncbi:MAG: sugar phosphate isomerase/epimerase [Bacteroidetes bacterium]|nr:sugar phosphate isomerase/epimerase [Bacteroidota bacterium]
MLNRRKFIRNTSALAAGSLLLPHWGCGEESSQTENTKAEVLTSAPKNVWGRPYGVQLYTLRSKFPDDFSGQLEILADIGYTELESFAMETHYCGLPLAEYKAITKDFGLKTVSSHIRTGKLTSGDKSPDSTPRDVKPGYLTGSMTQNLPAIIDAALDMGQSYLVLAYLEEFEYQGLDAWNQTLDLCLSVAEQCKKRGIEFCYHNHAFEFLAKNKEGQNFYEFLLTQSEGSNMNMEMDLYWVHKAGEDPQKYFQRYPGRFPLWHVKDMDATPEQGITGIGAGVIDFVTIFESADRAGLKHFFVEQDYTPDEPIESLRQSFENMTLMFP